MYHTIGDSLHLFDVLIIDPLIIFIGSVLPRIKILPHSIPYPSTSFISTLWSLSFSLSLIVIEDLILWDSYKLLHTIQTNIWGIFGSHKKNPHTYEKRYSGTQLITLMLPKDFLPFLILHKEFWLTMTVNPF